MDDETIISAFEVEWLNLIEMDYLEYKGYKGTVGYSKEDDCLVGKVIGMHDALILYEGKTLDDLKEYFRNAVDSYIDAIKFNPNIAEAYYRLATLLWDKGEINLSAAIEQCKSAINLSANSTARCECCISRPLNITTIFTLLSCAKNF